MAKIREYKGEAITVLYDVRRCIHAAECVRGLPDVFDSKARPWIDPDGAAAQRVAEVVERCPTGALAYVRSDGGPEEVSAPEPRMELVKDGPIYVRGPIAVVDAEGKPCGGPPRAALCRCGHSKNKPFCDNSHVEAGFRSEGSS